jgi:hypothetical protein
MAIDERFKILRRSTYTLRSKLVYLRAWIN